MQHALYFAPHIPPAASVSRSAATIPAGAVGHSPNAPRPAALRFQRQGPFPDTSVPTTHRIRRYIPTGPDSFRIRPLPLPKTAAHFPPARIHAAPLRGDRTTVRDENAPVSSGLLPDCRKPLGRFAGIIRPQHPLYPPRVQAVRISPSPNARHSRPCSERRYDSSRARFPSAPPTIRTNKIPGNGTHLRHATDAPHSSQLTFAPEWRQPPVPCRPVQTSPAAPPPLSRTTKPTDVRRHPSEKEPGRFHPNRPDAPVLSDSGHIPYYLANKASVRPMISSSEAVSGKTMAGLRYHICFPVQ